jgi:ribonuclease P/MRP protein subunit POP5
MKVLPSSLREKKRYIAFEVEYEGDSPPDRKAVLDEIFFATQTLLGDSGSAEIGWRLIDFDGKRGIIKVSLKGLEKARAALATVTSIKGQRAAIRILGASGTIKAAIEKYIVPKNIVSTSILSEVKVGNLSGTAVRKRGEEIDIVPDDEEATRRANVRYAGVTSFDLQ